MNHLAISILLIICISLLPIASAQVGTDYRGAMVLSPVGPNDGKLLRVYDEIETVFVMRAADDHVFDDPKVFPRLRNVSLAVNASNLGNLRALCKNYPGLSCITVRQTDDLSDEAVMYLKSFKQMKSLELSCKVLSPSLLLQGMPPGLEQLEIRDSNLLHGAVEAENLQHEPKINVQNDKMTAHLAISAGDSNMAKIDLPSLKELTIEHGCLTPSFIQSLQAPGLRRLCLFGVDVQAGALRNLKRFRSLQELNLAGSILTKDDLDGLAAVRAEVVAPKHVRLEE